MQNSLDLLSWTASNKTEHNIKHNISKKGKERQKGKIKKKEE